jgi:hypothetical protein
MKLRVRSNSVRLRLTQTEVSRVQKLGECAEVISFPGGAYLAYSLHASECDAVRAEFERCTVKIYVPRKEILEWSTTQAVGIYATVEAEGVALRVLIEKDFRCLDKTHEDQSDMFSNPNAESVSC